MGYAPEWQRQSMAKTGGSKVKEGVISKPIFHEADSRNSNAKQTPFNRHYDNGGEVVYDKTDKGMFGGEVKYREDESTGRKYVPTKDPLTGRAGENRYYSMDDIKNFFKGSSRKQEADTTSTAPSPTYTGAAAPSAENESRKKAIMGDAASQARVAKSGGENNPTTYTPNSDPQKSKIYKAEPADVEVVRFKEPPAIVGKKLRDETADQVRSRSPVRSDNSADKWRSWGREQNAALPSKPYPVDSKPNDERPSKTTPNGSYSEDEVREAGIRYAGAFNAMRSAPPETSETARKAIAQFVEDARDDYERKSKRMKRSD